MTAAYVAVRYGGMVYAAGTAVDGIYYELQRLSILFRMNRENIPCYTLLLLTNTVQVLLIFCLQGLITMRVRALYRQSKKITYILYGFLALSQVGNVVSTMDTLIVSNRHSDDFGFGGIQLLSGVLGCEATYNTSLWAFFIFIGTTISFEVVAVTLALHRFWTHYKDMKLEASSLWKANDLFHLVARENLIYFFASAACMAMVGLGKTSGYNEASATFTGLRLVLETFWLTMFGPYLILNVRRHDADRINGRFLPGAHSMSSIGFAPGQGGCHEHDE